jgi:hypothetical protein
MLQVILFQPEIKVYQDFYQGLLRKVLLDVNVQQDHICWEEHGRCLGKISTKKVTWEVYNSLHSEVDAFLPPKSLHYLVFQMPKKSSSPRSLSISKGFGYQFKQRLLFLGDSSTYSLLLDRASPV